MQDALVRQLYVSQPTGERLSIGEAMAMAAPAAVMPARQAPAGGERLAL
jgi:hypothetical protein